MTAAADRKPRACARSDCDWTADPNAADPQHTQAVAHAVESGHLLCRTCTRSLGDYEQRVCERCISKAQSEVRQIVELYALLPEQMGIPPTQVYDRGGGSGGHGDAEARPLPGGQALVLRSPGGSGHNGRRLRPAELRDGLVQNLDGREHMVDNKEEDGLSVVDELTTWEDDWRRAFGDPAASAALDLHVDQWWLPGRVGPLLPDQMRRLATIRALAGPGRTDRTLLAAATYLEQHMRAAATGAVEDFPEFLDEIRALRRVLQAATSTGDLPKHAPAACLTCARKTLYRVYRRPDACTHPRPSLFVPEGPEPKHVRIARHQRELEAWAKAHESCDQGGLTAKWECATCDRVYTDEEYNLAQAEWMRTLSDEQHDDWLRPEAVATMLRITPKTLWHWIQRRQVTVACDVDSRSRLLVWWPDARDRLAELEERRRRRAEQLARRATKQQDSA